MFWAVYGHGSRFTLFIRCDISLNWINMYVFESRTKRNNLSSLSSAYVQVYMVYPNNNKIARYPHKYISMQINRNNDTATVINDWQYNVNTVRTRVCILNFVYKWVFVCVCVCKHFF